jgi:hypothetical protein
MIRRILTAAAISAVAVSTPVFAQGNSQKQKQKKSAPAPPSRNDLAAPPTTSVGSGGASPIAWVDDATVLDSGGVAFAVSMLRWSGGGMSELNVPVIDIALGLTRRVQFSASIPRVVASSDPNGAVGGLGTSYFSGKIAVFGDEKRGVKLAVSPTLEVLSPGVVDALAPGEHRVQMGFPVSAELDRGPVRVYGATGYFTRGAWFTGAGVSVVLTERTAVSGGFSRSWRRALTPDVPLGDRDRNELSGSVSYGVTPSMRMFGSLGRTIATLDENGAGTVIAGGVSFFFAAPATK